MGYDIGTMDKQNYLIDISWKQICNWIKERHNIPKFHYENLLSLKILDFTADKISFYITGAFQKATLESYRYSITEAVKELYGDDIEVVTVTPEFRDETLENNSNLFKLKKVEADFNFDNFIIGRSNAEAHNSILTVCANLGKLYNPLLIHGDSGLGKTHLLSAAANFLRLKDPELKIFFIDTTQFVSDCISALNNNKIEEFKAAVSMCDVLILDDIQFFSKKEKTCEVFFSIFNNLYEDRKQIILSSDRHPEYIKDISNRLRTRFVAGLDSKITLPETETRIKIIKAKLGTFNNHNLLEQNQNHNITDEAIEYLAKIYENKDVRSLEGVVNKLLFRSINLLPSNSIIDLNEVMKIFGEENDLVKNDKSIIGIKHAVCDYYGLTLNQLVSKSKVKTLLLPRQIAMYLCRKILDVPFEKIGEELGKKNHTTVMHACDKIESLLKTDPKVKIAIKEIQNTILFKDKH